MKTAVRNMFSSTGFRVAAGIGISFLAFYLALGDVDLSSIAATLQQVDPGYLTLVLASVGLNIIAKTVRWKTLVGAVGRGIPLGRYLEVLSVGQFVNAFIPGRVGDLGRAYVIGGMGPGRTYVLGSIAVEKVFDLISYAVIFMFLLLLIPLPAWIGQSAVSVLVIAVGLTGVLVGLTLYRKQVISFMEHWTGRLPERFTGAVFPRLRSGFESLEILRSWKDLAWLVFWTVVIWTTAVLNNHLLLLAFGITLPIAAALLLLVALQAGFSFYSSPGTIGVFEYICILSLAVFGIDRAAALSYGILLHVMVLLPFVLAGLAAFVRGDLTGSRYGMSQEKQG